jgi:hypothetical protein
MLQIHLVFIFLFHFLLLKLGFWTQTLEWNKWLRCNTFAQHVIRYWPISNRLSVSNLINNEGVKYCRLMMPIRNIQILILIRLPNLLSKVGIIFLLCFIDKTSTQERTAFQLVKKIVLDFAVLVWFVGVWKAPRLL